MAKQSGAQITIGVRVLDSKTNSPVAGLSVELTHKLGDGMSGNPADLVWCGKTGPDGIFASIAYAPAELPTEILVSLSHPELAYYPFNQIMLISFPEPAVSPPGILVGFMHPKVEFRVRAMPNPKGKGKGKKPREF